MGNTFGYKFTDEEKLLIKNLNGKNVRFRLMTDNCVRWPGGFEFVTATIYDLNSGKKLASADGPDEELAIARVKYKLLN